MEVKNKCISSEIKDVIEMLFRKLGSKKIMKTAEEYLKEKNITPETKHHNYDYVYHSVLGAIEQAQKDAFKEGQSSPKIKQLEWVKPPFFEGDFEAKCGLGEYFIYDCEGSITLVCPDQSLKHKFSTIDEAKAAAQADFEQRVRECLDLKAQQKQALIDMMRGDEQIGLYDDN
jgi:hypothetical protein